MKKCRRYASEAEAERNDAKEERRRREELEKRLKSAESRLETLTEEAAAAREKASTLELILKDKEKALENVIRRGEWLPDIAAIMMVLYALSPLFLDSENDRI